MRKLSILAVSVLLAMSLTGCGGHVTGARSEKFHSDLAGGDAQWIYWPGKKGSVAMWLAPVGSQEPLITLTCVKDGRKLNARGYAFQSYQGSSGPYMAMTIEGGGVALKSRLSWAPTGDTPIARGDMRVTRKDLDTLAAAGKITFGVETEKYVIDGFGKAGKKFPAACAKALGVS